MQLKLYCILSIHDIETFQKTFVLGFFLLVVLNPMYIPVLNIALVDYMQVKHVHVERILGWWEGYAGIF